MLLRRLSLAILVLVLLGTGPSAVEAKKVTVGTVLGFPFRWLGGQFFGGGVDKLKGTLSSTVKDVDGRLTKHEDHVADLAHVVLTDAKGKVDDSIDRLNYGLEARILQIKTSADDSVDRALSQVNAQLRNRLIQLDAIGQGLVSGLGREARASLDHFDEILRERSADIDRMGHGWIDHADQVLEDRIAQLDEAAGRRLGNVDVIASKQRIALERSAIRVAVLIGLVGFVVYVLRELWRAHSELPKKELDEVRGAARTAFLVRRLSPTLAAPLASAAVGMGVLWALYQWLPMGAAREAQELTLRHERQLDAAVGSFDYVRARFHAAQLELLNPEQATMVSAKAAKVGLLRDLVARPALLATREAIGAFEQRLVAVERGLGPRPDADVLVMRAILKWEAGETRTQEHEAASLCARALRLSPRGFALAALARAYVQSFLDAPYVPDDAVLGRNAASLHELEDALAGAPSAAPDSPFAPMIELSGLMRALDRASTAHYIGMIEAHAQIAAIMAQPVKTRNEGALPALFRRRSEHAEGVAHAWTQFDAALTEHAIDGPIVLNVFRLNDALLTRALWFLERPTTVVEAPRLEDLGDDPKALALKLQLSPPRVAWARRYRDLLRGPARQVVEFEEAERFRLWEKWTIEFEQATVAHAQARLLGTDEEQARWRVVLAASALALYFDDGGQRVPYAGWVAGTLQAPPAGTTTGKRTPDAPSTLRDALRVRGIRLI